MTTTYDWPTERDRATNLFNGDTPGPAIEANVLHHFHQHPGRVHTLIGAIGNRIAKGASITSGWAILNHELNTKPAPVVATDNAEKAKQIHLAEQWIRNAGRDIVDHHELVDELFGVHGRLHDWKSDHDLHDRLLELWRSHHWETLAATVEADQRGQRQGDVYRRLRTMTHHAEGDQAADDHATRIAAEVERARTAANALTPAGDINWEAA